MFSICIHCILFELCLAKRKKEKRRRKKMNKIEIFVFGFSTLLKASGTNRVDLALQQQREVVCKLFELLCFFFLGAATIPYYRRIFRTCPIPSQDVLLYFLRSKAELQFKTNQANVVQQWFYSMYICWCILASQNKLVYKNWFGQSTEMIAPHLAGYHKILV